MLDRSQNYINKYSIYSYIHKYVYYVNVRQQLPKTVLVQVFKIILIRYRSLILVFLPWGRCTWSPLLYSYPGEGVRTWSPVLCSYPGEGVHGPLYYYVPTLGKAYMVPVLCSYPGEEVHGPLY